MNPIVLKTITAIVRFFINVFGWFLVGGLSLYFGTNLVQKTLNLQDPNVWFVINLYVALIVLIFPFRLLRSAVYVTIYFYLLIPTTIFFLVLEFLSLFYVRLDKPETLISPVMGFCYVFNLYSVWLYRRHRLNAKEVNPFFPILP